MSLSRIYQGRVNRLELKSQDGDWVIQNEADRPIACPIWIHHATFQRAINYYLLAFARLAKLGKSENRVIQDLPSRIGSHWDSFPGAPLRSKGLRSSLKGWVPGISGNTDFDTGLQAINLPDDLDPAHGLLALESLLADLGGDGKIQKGSKTYFALFCEASSKANFPRSRVGLLKDEGKYLVPTLLAGDTADSAVLASIRERLQFEYFANPNESAEPLTDESSHKRLAEAIAGARKTEPALGDAVWMPIEQTLENLNEPPAIPRYFFGGAGPEIRKRRLDLYLLIKHLQAPRPIFDALRSCFSEPPKNAPQITDTEQHLRSLGDDPILLARSDRGFVFPAFTALAPWNTDDLGKPSWRNFDIMAFAQALTALNQFKLKTDEREDEKKKLQARFDFMTGVSEKFDAPKPSEDDEVERAPNRIRSSDLELAAELREKLVKVGEFGFTKAALRGYRDVRDAWLELEKQGNKPTQKELRTIVSEHHSQQGERFGSVPLFQALCEDQYRPLWRNDEVEDGYPNDIVWALSDLDQLVRDLERKQEIINLTPAEPEYSRRLYMFSDQTGGTKTIIGDGTVEVSLAAPLEGGGRFGPIRARLSYTAPRMLRDGLMGENGNGWLQPMFAALGLPPLKPDKDPACALMPKVEEISRSGTAPMLLNFPVTLSPKPLANVERWNVKGKKFFNGTNEKNLHMLWNDGAPSDGQPFTFLSCDLGVRMSSAWALMHCGREKPEHDRWRMVDSGDGQWIASWSKTGTHRLPGERGVISLPNGKKVHDSRGRRADGIETAAAVKMELRLGGVEESREDIQRKMNAKTLPEQNDRLIWRAGRRLSRLRTYHRWSCATVHDTSPENLRDELKGYSDSDLTPWKDRLDAGDNDARDAFAKAMGEKFESLRSELGRVLTELAERCVPLRGADWVWERNPDQPEPTANYHRLVRSARLGKKGTRRRGMRGLSMDRIGQLENLRKLFLRHNRSFDRGPGETKEIGTARKGERPGEPCRDLLNKIDRMKNERVNLTAHLILANALGLRLKAPTTDKDDYVHGEYERIPGRNPVDFIVMEDLSRYLTAQGRAPSENRQLMRWSHRAVLLKLKELCESFDLPVVEVVPAYSSKFCARSGVPGFRCREIASGEQLRGAQARLWRDWNDETKAKLAGEAGSLFRQIETLEKINKDRLESKKPPHNLFVPEIGGPLFMPASGDLLPSNADTNAAINLGLRTVANPKCFDIHRRIPSERNGQQLKARRNNKREKEAFDANQRTIEMVDEPSTNLAKSPRPNFFYDPEGISNTDRARCGDLNLTSQVALLGKVRASELTRCIALNEARLNRSGWRNDQDEIPM